MTRITAPFLALAILASPTAVGRQATPWMFGPFEKPTQVNPIIALSATATFLSPMTDSVVKWEELAIFNPAPVD